MTYPMTSVRALIEAAGKHDAHDASEHSRYPLVNEKIAVAIAALKATASISQLLSEHDKVVEYIKELQFLSGTLPFAKQCHDRLQSIVEGKRLAA